MTQTCDSILMPLDAWITEKIGGAGRRLDLSQLRAHQVECLRDTLALVHAGSRFYRRLLGAHPPEISGLEDLARLPFTTADDLREDPYAFLCVHPDEVTRIVTLPTSGTTGPPKRLFFSADDQELTRDFFHHGMSTMVGPGDRVAILLPGSTPGSVGALLQEGLARMDVESIVLGPVHDPEETLRRLALEETDALVGIPVQVLGLARLSRARGIPLKVKSVLLSTDHLPRAVREAIEASWSCSVFDHYGMTEMGLGGGVDCRARSGYHLREADLLFEVVDPESGRAVAPGEWGEVVFTTLTRTAMPLLRYRTGDLSRFLPDPCPCGTALRRLAHVPGRVRSGVSIGAGWVTQGELDACLLALANVVDFTAGVKHGEGGTELHVSVKFCAGSAPLSRRYVEDILRANLPALGRGIETPVSVHVHDWPAEGKTDESTRLGTGKRRITSLM